MFHLMRERLQLLLTLRFARSLLCPLRTHLRLLTKRIESLHAFQNFVLRSHVGEAWRGAFQTIRPRQLQQGQKKHVDHV